jgi:hypothetical protein
MTEDQKRLFLDISDRIKDRVPKLQEKQLQIPNGI